MHNCNWEKYGQGYWGLVHGIRDAEGDVNIESNIMNHSPLLSLCDTLNIGNFTLKALVISKIAFFFANFHIHFAVLQFIIFIDLS